MTNVNLKTEKTEHLSLKEIYQFFVPPEESKEITKLRNTYLVGHKGSGKSIFLKYLSVPIQLIRLDEKTTIEFDKKAIGILIQCNIGKFGGLIEQSENLDRNWRHVFTHIFNLCVLERMLQEIKLLYDRKKDITKDEMKIFLNKTIKLFHLNTKINTYEGFMDFLDDSISCIQEEHQQETYNRGRFYTDHTTLYEIRRIFQESFKNYSNIEPVFLLDEYNELSNGQQKIINEMIRLRLPRFKMSTIPQGYIQDRVNEGQIDIDHEFDIAYLANKPLTPNSSQLPKLLNFMGKVWEKRIEKQLPNMPLKNILENPKSIKSSKRKRTQSEIREINEFNYTGFVNYVILSEGNPKTFLDLIQDTLDNAEESKIEITKQKISTRIQLDTILGYSLARRKEISKADPTLGRDLQKLVEYFGKYLKIKTKGSKDQYRSIAIKDDEKLSDRLDQTLKLGLKSSWLIQDNLGRISKTESVRLEKFSLKNILIPSFELPLIEHQIWEISSDEVNKILDPEIHTIERERERDGQENKDREQQKGDLKTPPLENYDIIEKIKEQIQQKRLILFIGSGFSSHAGIISASALAKKICEEFGTTKELSLEKVSQFLANRKGKKMLIDLIKKEISDTQKTDLALYQKILRLGIKTIVTTNWDDLLEIACKRKNMKIQTIVTPKDMTSYKDDEFAVIKIHGDLDNTDHIVVTDDHYNDYKNTHQFMLTRLKSILQNKSVLFIGYSLSDRNFREIRNMVGNELGDLRESYAIFLNIDGNEKVDLSKKNIMVLESDFTWVLNNLVDSS